MTRKNSKKKTFFYFLISISVVLMTFILIEISLRVASVFVGPRSLVEDGGETKHIILSLGDSNTYGVYYSEEEAYPGQLQRILEERAEGSYRVLNLGLPGMNSSQVALQLSDWIDQYHPHSVVVCVGVNNYWNRSGFEKLEVSPRLWVRWLHGLRLYRLFSVLRNRLEAPMPFSEKMGRPKLKRILKNEGKEGVEHRDAESGELLISHEGNIHKTHNKEDVLSLIERDLTTMLVLTRKHGVRLILLTYAAFDLPGREKRFSRIEVINRVMREFSRRQNVQIVDLKNHFSELLPKGIRRALYFANEKEAHPNPAGYLEIATLIAGVFEPAKE